MGKAILVLDEMPVECRQCNILEIDYDTDLAVCNACLKVVSNDIYFNKPIMRPAFCPLRNMPPEATPDNSDMPVMWNVGWNACLKELCGEDDDDEQSDTSTG